MKFDQSKGVMDFNEYKQFYAEEIEGKMHRWTAQINLEKAKKWAKLGLDEEDQAPE